MRIIAALAAITLAGCTGGSQAAATPTPPASPSPVASTSAESKAADFRIRLDLLLGEHVIIVAKQSASTSGQAEYTGYLHLLTTNGADLTGLVRSAMGDSVAARFDEIWSAQNNYLVQYTIGLVTRDKNKANAAQAGLTDTFAPQFSQFLSDVAQVPSAVILPLVNQHVLEMKAMLDDRLAGNYPKLYGDISIAYVHAAQVGDVIAPMITSRFPDKFPGSAAGRAVDLRAFMNTRLQEHSLLATMRTDAAIGGRMHELSGALGQSANALDAVFGDLFGQSTTAQFDSIWASGDAATIAYASASTAPQKQRALARLTDTTVAQVAGWLASSCDLAAEISQPALEAQLEALVTVIDDQRSKSWSRVAADDRTAATAAEVVADLVAAAVIAKLPARFG